MWNSWEKDPSKAPATTWGRNRMHGDGRGLGNRLGVEWCGKQWIFFEWRNLRNVEPGKINSNSECFFLMTRFFLCVKLVAIGKLIQSKIFAIQIVLNLRVSQRPADCQHDSRESKRKGFEHHKMQMICPLRFWKASILTGNSGLKSDGPTSFIYFPRTPSNLRCTNWGSFCY